MNVVEQQQNETRVGKTVAESPLVSVIIPAYNCSEYIAESVDAVLSQTFSDFEIVIVNDGSDDTPELERALEPYMDRITYVLRKNGGAGAARNSGIRIARGEYLGFVDGDDIWYPEFLEKQLAALREKGCDMINCDALFFGDTAPGRTFFGKLPAKSPVTTESLIRGESNLILSGTLIKKAAVVENGMFRDERLELAFEDYELWFRMCKNGVRIEYNREILLGYRVHKSNSSGNILRIVERGLASTEYLKENFELDPSEHLALIDRRNQFKSQLAIEKAKIHLAHGNYRESLRLVSESASSSESRKIHLIEYLMKFSPALTRVIFRAFRRQEFERALRDAAPI